MSYLASIFSLSLDCIVGIRQTDGGVSVGAPAGEGE